MGLGSRFYFYRIGFVFVEKEKIKATKLPWSIDAEVNLIVSMGEDAEELANQVKNGIAELWHFEQGEKIDIWTIVRREKNQLVVCCIEGIGSREVVPLIEKSSKQAGCDSLRVHITRPGLSRMFPKWELKEYVYERKI